MCGIHCMFYSNLGHSIFHSDVAKQDGSQSKRQGGVRWDGVGWGRVGWGGKKKISPFVKDLALTKEMPFRHFSEMPLGQLINGNFSSWWQPKGIILHIRQQNYQEGQAQMLPLPEDGTSSSIKTYIPLSSVLPLTNFPYCKWKYSSDSSTSRIVLYEQFKICLRQKGISATKLNLVVYKWVSLGVLIS